MESKDRALISGDQCQQSSKAEATKCQMKQNSYSSTFEGRKILAEFPQYISPPVFKTGVCRFFAFLKSVLPEHTHEYAEKRQQTGQVCTLFLKGWTVLA